MIPYGEIAKSSQSAVIHGAAVFDFTGACVRRLYVEGVDGCSIPRSRGSVGETSRTKAVVVEFGHQMSLRRGGHPRGLRFKTATTGVDRYAG